MNGYNEIFSSINIKSMTLKNRIVMLPMGTNFAKHDGEISDEHICYYEKRAKGGVGLIIVENACVDFPLGSNGTTQLRIDHDSFLPALYKLTEKVHKYGTCISVQINHAGACASQERTGMESVSSSNIPAEKGGVIPKPLNKEEILTIVEKYGKAAKRAQIAGFDAVEIHFGHSYLVNQFLSPLYNNREDEFGGSIENRARFPRLVLESVRKNVGHKFPIGIRISADELIDGGNTLKDTLKLLEYFDEFVDLYNVSAGVIDTKQYQVDKMDLEDGWRTYMAKEVKEKFKKPTITNGNIKTPNLANELIKNGTTDLIGLGRSLIADPNWVNKAKNGEEDSVRKCISCNICQEHRVPLNRPIRCTVNPDVIKDNEYQNIKIKSNTNVVVIGGGTAGIEAACTAAELGCKTFLIEKSNQIGGLARKIAKFPSKKRILDFHKYLENRINKLENLFIYKNIDANIDFIDSLNPHIIINSTGSKPLLPSIEGLIDNVDKTNGKVYSAVGLLDNLNGFSKLNLKDKEIVIAGGGGVGLDVAEYFCNSGSKVTIVELLPSIGLDLDTVTKNAMYEILEKSNTNVLTNTKLESVHYDYFTVSRNNKYEELYFDYGFVCLGMKCFTPLLTELEDYFTKKNVKVLNIGDSKRARKIIDGTREGRDMIYILE